MAYVDKIQNKAGTLYDIQDARVAAVSSADQGKILTVTSAGLIAAADAPDTGVVSFNGRAGAVVPVASDYTPAFIGAIPATEKGANSGVATLDETGKVPAAQLPEMNYIPTSQKGANSGVAELDASGKVPSAQLPSYVDDVLEYASVSEFPATGESGKIYIALDTNKTYRWSGSTYVEISPSLALGETESTAYRGDRGKTAYDHSQLTSGNPHNVTKADLGIITPSSVTCTLASASWSGSAAPFTQAVSVTGVTASTVGTFGLATSATSTQYAAAAAAQLMVTAQASDSITVTAYGDKPTVDIPCVMNIVG